MRYLFTLFLVLVITALPIRISGGSEAGTILRILDGVVGQQAEQERQAREQEALQREREQELEHRERQVYERETLLREREQKLELEMQRQTEELKHRERKLEQRERQVRKQEIMLREREQKLGHRKRQAQEQRDTERKNSVPRKPAVPALTSSKKVNRFLQTGQASCELAMELILYDIPGPGGHGPRQLRLEHSDLGHRYDDQIDLIKTMHASHVRKIRELIKKAYPNSENYIAPLWNLYAWTNRC